MEHEWTRVLFVSPYEGLKTAVERAVVEFPELQLEAHIADMENGAEMVRQLPEDSYDVILSRGGTAELIRLVTKAPVVDIPISIYDVLRTMRKAEAHNERFAIAGFSRNTRTAHTLCSLMQYERKIVTFHSRSDIVPSLDALLSEGYTTVVCDVAAHGIAK